MVDQKVLEQIAIEISKAIASLKLEAEPVGNSLDMLRAKCRALRTDHYTAIIKALDSLQEIDRLEAQSIELTFPDSWKLKHRSLSFVTFEINSKLLSFSVEPVYIALETNHLPLDSQLEKEVDKARDFSGRGLQKLIDYFIPLLESHHNDLEYLFTKQRG